MNELDDENFVGPDNSDGTLPYTDVDPEGRDVNDPGVTPVVTPPPTTVDNQTDRTTAVNTSSIPPWMNDILKNMFGTKPDGTPNFSGGQAGMAALMALLAAKFDTQKPTGGGTTKAYAGYTPITRTMGVGPSAQPGIPGQPIARYAGIGALPNTVQHTTPPPDVEVLPPVNDRSGIDDGGGPGPGNDGYAQGGIVALEDGGFVMTKKAVDGAGGPGGIRRLVPGAQPLRGPGTGTSDSIPARIHSPRGATPAAVSNGEAYIPPNRVQQAGGAPAMYSLMNKLQKGR